MAAFVSSFTGLRLGTPTGASVAPQFKGARREVGRLGKATFRMSTEVKTEVPDVLKSILARKEDEVAALKAEVAAAGPEHPIAKRLAGPNERSTKFSDALNKSNKTLSIIAEVKRRSPSKGFIGEIKDPASLAKTYWESGASVISVLTDLEGFGGTLDDLRTVVEEQQKYVDEYPPPCPVLRKDFTIDAIQIAEAAVAGADAILLIVAALGKEKTVELLKAAQDIGIEALVEVHDEEEAKIAVEIGARVIGVNNRNLHTFEVSLETSKRLRSMIPEDRIAIAESGISGNLDAWNLRDMGYQAILVGEVLVRAHESSRYGQTMYQAGYNQAKGLIKAFKAKGSVLYGPTTTAAFYGKGEGAKETLGEICM